MHINILKTARKPHENPKKPTRLHKHAKKQNTLPSTNYATLIAADITVSPIRVTY